MLIAISRLGRGTMKIEPQYKDVDGDIELEPFARTNWIDAEARDAWRDRLQRAAEAKFEAEWRSVLDGETDRKAAIIHVSNQSREKWLRRIGDHDLVFRDIRYSEPYDGFAHQHHSTDKSNPQRITYSVIAQDEDVAEEMKDAELNGQGKSRHRRVGELLGFPDCCLDFFGQKWLDDRRLDPMYEITCNTESAEKINGDPTDLRVVNANAGVNTLWKYFGWSFITHIPCSWECERSAEIARNRYRIMKENGYGDAADALATFLDMPFEWSGYHGLAEVQNDVVIGTSRTDDHWTKKQIQWL